MRSPQLLRLALRANAVFSAVCGGLALWLKQDLAVSLALPAVAIEIAAWLLVVYGFLLSMHSGRALIATPWTRVVIGLDLGWVIGSCLLLALHEVPSVTLVAVTAAAVLSLAGLQWWGLRRAGAPAR
jgi:hypothetical protein